MTTDCCQVPPRAGSAGRGRLGSALTLALGVALALVPKCPMCIAAYLSVFGLGMAAASAIAPWCWPLAIALLLVSPAWYVGARRLRAAGRRGRHAAKDPPSTAIGAPVT
jgi:hypothetical protein